MGQSYSSQQQVTSALRESTLPVLKDLDGMATAVATRSQYAPMSTHGITNVDVIFQKVDRITQLLQQFHALNTVDPELVSLNFRSYTVLTTFKVLVMNQQLGHLNDQLTILTTLLKHHLATVRS